MVKTIASVFLLLVIVVLTAASCPNGDIWSGNTLDHDDCVSDCEARGEGAFPVPLSSSSAKALCALMKAEGEGLHSHHDIGCRTGVDWNDAFYCHTREFSTSEYFKANGGWDIFDFLQMAAKYAAKC